jgi:hypothetical protein
VSHGWTPVAASVIGSVHVRDGVPLQDAWAAWAEGSGAVLAVADGHGHRDHPRSDIGATLAAEVAVGELRRALTDLSDVRRIAAGVVEAWRDAVDHHSGDGAASHRAYGTTLLVVAVGGPTLVVLQIGDGDVVLVAPDGTPSRPLGRPAGHDGVHTASLCQPDPLDDLRVAVVPSEQVALAYACTDGFGAARVEADWWARTGRQLHAYAEEHGAAWIAAQLPGWLEEPARVGGDDTTLAVLLREER